VSTIPLWPGRTAAEQTMQPASIQRKTPGASVWRPCIKRKGAPKPPAPPHKLQHQKSEGFVRDEWGAEAEPRWRSERKKGENSVVTT